MSSIKTFARHIPHYFLLFGILLAGFAGLILFSYDKNFQMMVALATGISYIIWGTFHHHSQKDLHLEVFVEYVVISILGMVILFTLILG